MAVLDEGSFSGASRSLNLAVSAVSRQVSDLEHHYGCQLLYRTTRAMNLTAEGQLFLPEFREILARLDGLEDVLHAERQKIAGTLKITTPEHSQGLGLQAAISGFLARYPEVRITWLQLNRFVNLIDEGVDLAIRVGKLNDSTLIARNYQETDVLYVASPEYLKKYGEPQHPSELSKYKCIIETTSNNARRWRYYENGQEKHVRIGGVIEVNQSRLVADFAADGHGIAQLPRFMMQNYIEQGALIPILKPYEVPPLPLSLIYPANKMMKPALRAFIDYLLAQRQT